MSEYHNADTEVLDIDVSHGEVDIYVTENDFGSIYITLTFEQILDLAERINRARIEK